MAERTLIIIKPDAVQRHLVGEIIGRFEKKGLQLVAGKFIQVSEDLAGKLYSEHEGKPFYKPLMVFLTSGPVFVTVWQADAAISMVRKLAGATFGPGAEPGTIRGDFGSSNRYNLVHGSDSPESAEREIDLFFEPDEIINYKIADAAWLSEKNI